MRKVERLDAIYAQLCEIHKKYFPDMRLGQFLLNGGEFVIFEFQTVAHVDAEGQQGDGHLGDHAGIVVLDEGIVAADVDNGAEHNCSSVFI